MSLLEIVCMTTANTIGQTSATDLSPGRRICRSMRWICWAKTCRKKAMPCANLHICAKKQRTCQVFCCFFTGFFGIFRGIFGSFHNNSKHFYEKSGRWHTNKGLCAHTFVLFVRRGDKKKSPITGQMQGFAAPSTRYGAQSPACCRVCAFEQLV